MDVDYSGLSRVIAAVASLVWFINVSTCWLWNLLHYNVTIYYCMFLTLVDASSSFLYTVKQSNTFNKFTGVKSCSSLSTENTVFMSPLCWSHRHISCLEQDACVHACMLPRVHARTCVLIVHLFHLTNQRNVNIKSLWALCFRFVSVLLSQNASESQPWLYWPTGQQICTDISLLISPKPMSRCIKWQETRASV